MKIFNLFCTRSKKRQRNCRFSFKRKSIYSYNCHRFHCVHLSVLLMTINTLRRLNQYSSSGLTFPFTVFLSFPAGHLNTGKCFFNFHCKTTNRISDIVHDHMLDINTINRVPIQIYSISPWQRT